MRSGGKIPELVAYVVERAARETGGDAYHLTAYPPRTGFAAKVFPIQKSSQREETLSRLRNSFPDHDVISLANGFISGLTICRRISVRGRYMYEVADSDNRIFVVEDHVVMDSAMHDSVVNGIIGGTFIWADIPYMGMQPLRVGSAAHEQVRLSHLTKTAPAIKYSELMPGDILQTAGFSTMIYLGSFVTKTAARNLTNLSGPLTLEDKTVNLFYNPLNWTLRNPRKALMDPAGFAEDFANYMNPSSVSDFDYRFCVGRPSFKRKVGRIDVSCRIAGAVAKKAADKLTEAVRGLRASSYVTGLNRTHRMLDALEKHSQYVHLSDVGTTPVVHPLYSTAEFYL